MRINDKKGQTAFELLTTYGWVVLTTIVIAGVLAFLNFTNPTIFIEEDCSVSPEFSCIEYGLFEGVDNSTALFLFRNRNEEPINNNSKILCYFESATVETTFNKTLEPGETIEVLCVGPKQDWRVDSKIKINFKIVYYTEYSSVGIAKTSNGHVYAEVK